MKPLRIAASFLFLLAATTVFAQSDAKAILTPESAQRYLGRKVARRHAVKVAFRPTSGGSALLSEVMGEHEMITMFHMDNDRVLITHIAELATSLACRPAPHPTERRSHSLSSMLPISPVLRTAICTSS